MAFVSAMSTPDSTRLGVKGSDVYTEAGVGDERVVLFTQLVRGLRPDEIRAGVQKIFATGDEAKIRDLAVMTFQTRDVRGGKGERDLFRHLFLALVEARPALVALVALVPEYGCWKDLWALWEAGTQPVRDAIDALVKKQFSLDQETLHPSLLVKWLPREGTKLDTLAKHFADLLFPLTPREGGQRFRVYRRALATLNRHADTTEIKMCAKEGAWAEIQPKKVPGRLMKRCKSAFFNQKKGPRGSTVERFPDRLDRVYCADNFKDFLEKVKKGEAKITGGQTTMPHEHVHEIVHNYNLSSEQEGVIQAQWDAIREETLKAGGLGKVVPLCDFSGSMDGVPKEVSLALGILISEIASPAFRDHILTFDSEPNWYSFRGKKSLKEKIAAVGGLGQGLSTDFQKAGDLVLRKLVENNVAPEDAPTDLLVLTDMGFDQACRSGVTSSFTGKSYTHNLKNKEWETHFQMIQSNFEKHGYVAPRIVCWNLRAQYKDYHATAETTGVVQLSGWSPAVLKALQKNGVEVKTPIEGLRALLDDARYDSVRAAIGKTLTEILTAGEA